MIFQTVPLLLLALHGPGHDPAARPTALKPRAEILSHVTVYQKPGAYCAWPSVARTSTGDLVVVYTRSEEHMGPDGAILLSRSTDSGMTWLEPVVLRDSPLDDRESGITTLRSGMLIGHCWSTQHTRASYEHLPVDSYEPDVLHRWIDHVETPAYHAAGTLQGGWMVRSDDGGRTWTEPVRATETVHGGIELADGSLLIASYRITRDSVTVHRADSASGEWSQIAVVAPRHNDSLRLGEPHMVQLPSGRIVMMMRATTKPYNDEDPRCVLWETYSDDGGETWLEAYATPLWGFPPHLALLSDGRVLCTYGYRRPPYGQRACISSDGITWKKEDEIVLRADAPNGDLGYPASIEVTPGVILTVYYQPQVPPGTIQRMKPPDPHRTKPGILGTFWRLPGL